jgi:cytochrome c-type biogenesis protein CcmH/NrfF
MRRLGLIVAVGLAALAAAVPVTASAATPRTTLNDVEDEVMCVACGVPLNIADSPQADRERALIQRLVDRGYTKQQVKDELVAQYTDRVLATPRDRGFGLAAYLVPIAIVLGALAALAVVVPRWRRSRTADTDGDPGDDGNAPAAPRLTEADARRLDEDMARYEV